ncbi:MAG: type II toxin-antitoxin system RelE/ParE family toxin [Verrucomicrobiota bacterium]|jgi:plasmid stabilization system protein ParE
MGCKLILAPQAVARLAGIIRSIAKDKPDAALRFGIHLIEHTQLLENFPDLGAPYRKRPNVRRLWCKPCFIYYRVKRQEGVVEVMDYWHSARQEPEFL